MFNTGAFGGAERRFTNLFLHLYQKYPDRIFYFVNNHLLNQIHRINKDIPENNIRVIRIPEGDNLASFEADSVLENTDDTPPRKFTDTIPDPVELDRKTSFLRKIYWFQKNKSIARRLYKTIDNYRNELNIKVFLGVFSGILPLVFFLRKDPRETAVIFSDMDSWFTDIHSDMKKLWYRKYYSFNYALENSDMVDFLSPYILEGVLQRGIRIDKQRTSITACSFTDYTKSVVGEKKNFEIAFSARLEPDKNPMLYLESAKRILALYPEVKFHILGEGSLADEIRHFISTNVLEGKINFRFLSNPPELFAKTSVFVSLQTGTNYPSQSVLEAMACGNAIVASNVGDTNLLINPNNGVLVDLSVDSLTSALINLINDPPLAHTLGLQGRRDAISKHTIERASEYYIDLINAVYRKVAGDKITV